MLCQCNCISMRTINKIEVQDRLNVPVWGTAATENYGNMSFDCNVHVEVCMQPAVWSN